MSAALTRAIQGKRIKSCATPNQPESVSGWLIALVVCAILALGFGMDVHTGIARLL